MIDVVSIVIAVISLLGSLAAAGFTGWITCYMDRTKQRRETKALIHKYRDPLMLAAYDLQSRLFGLVQQNLLKYHSDEEKKDLIYVYTAFLVGQYLSWSYILRRQAQFLRFATDKTNKSLNRILDNITNELSLNFAHFTGEENSFMLWRGQQMAIGELMTMEEEKGQLYCMGFAAFSHKYQNDAEFKNWFRPVEKGIGKLVDVWGVSERGGEYGKHTYRLRRLQHLLIDLVSLLDQDKVAARKTKVDAAPECRCEGCPGFEGDEQRLSTARNSKLPEP